MHEIIDVASDVGKYAEKLAQAGVKTVIRYYNHKNGPALPTKGLTRKELDALHGAGLSVAVVFQQRGGAGGAIGDLDAAAGTRDATRALALAATMGQPHGSAIYFAVDHDYYKKADLDRIADYFRAARQTLGGAFLTGVYGSGTLGKRLKADGLTDLIWLSGSTGWSGTKQALQDGTWTLFQKHLEKVSEIGGFIYDGNIANPASESFGQFSAGQAEITPVSTAPTAVYEVIARSGLNLRAGPGEEHRIFSTLPEGALVTGQGLAGQWMKVDLEGDGQLDGYMSAAFLRAVAGGLPLPPTSPRSPVAVARAELALNVAEHPGPQHNPRIIMYHKTTSGGGTTDETAWCSSFVNYCVEQAGMTGTDSKWARSWHDGGWGVAVTDAAVEGDIVVWRRHGGGDDGGHVAFFLSEDADSVLVLGGNQSNKICIQRYPKNGVLGPFTYRLLSIRRG